MFTDPRVASKPDKSKEATKDDILRKCKKNIIKKKHSGGGESQEPLLPYEDEEGGEGGGEDDLREQLSRRRAERAQVSGERRDAGSNPGGRFFFSYGQFQKVILY